MHTAKIKLKSFGRLAVKKGKKIEYNVKQNGAPYLMCHNSLCDWVKWNVPESVMNDYDGYISDRESELIDMFNHLDD